MGFGFQMRTAARRSRPTGLPVPAAVGLPAIGARIAHWSADGIPAQGDDTPLAGWTDAVGGITAVQASASARP